MEDSKEGDDREMMLRSGDGAGAENGRAAGELGALTPQDSTEESNGKAMPQNRVDGGVKEGTATSELNPIPGGLRRDKKLAGGADSAPPPEISRTKQDSDKR